MRTFILLLLTTYLTYAYCANRVSDNITKNSIAGLSLENQEIQDGFAYKYGVRKIDKELYIRNLGNNVQSYVAKVRTGITIGKKSFKKHLQNS